MAGLTNKLNIWASTLDTADVDVMKDRIKNGANLLESQVFQFDFLNDDFSKLPKGLLDIINSEEKRKKLIIYINPPYAEVSIKTIFAPNKNHFINKWISEYKIFYENPIGYMDGINANDFQNDCLAFTLFHGQNRISVKDGTNHWIPFSETDVNAKDNFESHFMNDFINGKINNSEPDDLFTEKTTTKALNFSEEAKAVLKAGKKLWKYYHSQPTANVNASYYDIREFFQGRDNSGKMNNKSGDDTYNALIGELRSAQKTLALKIQPKVYEYGFLVE